MIDSRNKVDLSVTSLSLIKPETYMILNETLKSKIKNLDCFAIIEQVKSTF